MCWWIRLFVHPKSTNFLHPGPCICLHVHAMAAATGTRRHPPFAAGFQKHGQKSLAPIIPKCQFAAVHLWTKTTLRIAACFPRFLWNRSFFLSQNIPKQSPSIGDFPSLCLRMLRKCRRTLPESCWWALKVAHYNLCFLCETPPDNPGSGKTCLETLGSSSRFLQLELHFAMIHLTKFSMAARSAHERTNVSPGSTTLPVPPFIKVIIHPKKGQKVIIITYYRMNNQPFLHWCLVIIPKPKLRKCLASITQELKQSSRNELLIPAGWWYTYPSEKYESQLVLLFQTYGK